MALAIITAADQASPPPRLALASDAYAMIGDALRGRLETLDAQQDIAYSTDNDDFSEPS